MSNTEVSEAEMYVLTVHTHCDDYKGADSDSDTLGIFTKINVAHFAGIETLLTGNYYNGYMESETLLKLIPSLREEEAGTGKKRKCDERLLEEAPDSTLLASIAQLDDDSLKTIFEELQTSLGEQEGEFTRRPSQTSVTICKMSCINSISDYL